MSCFCYDKQTLKDCALICPIKTLSCFMIHKALCSGSFLLLHFFVLWLIELSAHLYLRNYFHILVKTLICFLAKSWCIDWHRIHVHPLNMTLLQEAEKLTANKSPKIYFHHLDRLFFLKKKTSSICSFTQGSRGEWEHCRPHTEQQQSTNSEL